MIRGRDRAVLVDVGRRIRGDLAADRRWPGRDDPADRPGLRSEDGRVGVGSEAGQTGLLALRRGRTPRLRSPLKSGSHPIGRSHRAPSEEARGRPDWLGRSPEVLADRLLLAAGAPHPPFGHPLPAGEGTFGERTPWGREDCLRGRWGRRHPRRGALGWRYTSPQVSPRKELRRCVSNLAVADSR